jgi:hypothetical protein
LCGFPPNSETVTLRIPNGMWRPDTVITDYEGTEMFVLLDQLQHMRSYEAIFGDLDGRRLVCIKRHLIPAFWKDGYYFCTYQPNYKNQRPLAERDVDNKKVYPFSYLQVNPMKGRFYYRVFDNQEGLSPPKMRAENPWLGYMVVCCTPIVRSGKWTASFLRKNQSIPTIHVDQWRNCVDIGPGNDVLAALCMAYVFDRYQCQPLITVVGAGKEQYLQEDDRSIESNEDDKDSKKASDREVRFDNMPSNDDEESGIMSQNGKARTNADPNDVDDEYDDKDYGDGQGQGQLFSDFDEFINSRASENNANDTNLLSIMDVTPSNESVAAETSDKREDEFSVDDSLYTDADTSKASRSNFERTNPNSDIVSSQNSTHYFLDDESSSRSNQSSSFQQPTVFTENDEDDWLTAGGNTNDASTFVSSASSYNTNRSNDHDYEDDDSQPRIV